MSKAQLFRINAPTVAAQIIEGEAVLLHFESGSYYSTDKLGSEILDRIQRGESAEIMAAAWAERFAVDEEAASKVVDGFLAQLSAEQLIVEIPESKVAASVSEQPAVIAAQGTEFAEPVLEKFTDLEDLLLLDPIHDADETGWPAPAPKTDE